MMVEIIRGGPYPCSNQGKTHRMMKKAGNTDAEIWAALVVPKLMFCRRHNLKGRHLEQTSQGPSSCDLE